MFSFGTATRMDEKLDLNLGFTWAILNELGRGVSRGHEVDAKSRKREARDVFDTFYHTFQPWS